MTMLLLAVSGLVNVLAAGFTYYTWRRFPRSQYRRRLALNCVLCVVTAVVVLFLMVLARRGSA